MSAPWLPALRGSVVAQAPLAPHTTVKVGGAAELLVQPADWQEVAALLAAKPAQVPLTVLGKGSNMVVRDGGIPGLVLLLAEGCNRVQVQGTLLEAEAGAACGTAARAAREAGLTGLEFFGGIPGSIGGAIRMNAGAYGSNTFAALAELELLDAAGALHTVAPEFMQPRYRSTQLPAGWVIRAGRWRLQPGDKEAIRARMREINHARSSTQPLHLPSSGSWFKNVTLPADGPLGAAGMLVNAWKVVDAAGCRGWREGGAQVSEQHCNFFVNTGGATAAELERLSARVEAEVQARLGLVLEREVRFVGVEAGHG